jgi:hypothetical protein
MSMTKKHFTIIAEAIKNSTIETEEGEHIDQMCLLHLLCLHFRSINPLFDKSKFLNASMPEDNEYRRLKL